MAVPFNSKVTAKNAQDQRIVRWAAALVATGLFVATGLGYRLVSPALSAVRGEMTAPVGLLEQLPLEIGEWTGRDVPLEERVVRATDTDDHLNRVYRRSGVVESVSLYVAFGIRLRDLAPHRPEVCYPSSGWTLEKKRTVTISGDDGIEREAQLFRFRRGIFEAERIEVLSYYVVGGVHCRDVSLLRSTWWRGGSRPGYSAQVQIVASAGNDERESAELTAFAAAVAGPIARILEQAESNGDDSASPGGAS